MSNKSVFGFQNDIHVNFVIQNAYSVTIFIESLVSLFNLRKLPFRLISLSLLPNRPNIEVKAQVQTCVSIQFPRLTQIHNWYLMNCLQKNGKQSRPRLTLKSENKGKPNIAKHFRRLAKVSVSSPAYFIRILHEKYK